MRTEKRSFVVSILAEAEYVASALGLILSLKNLAMAIQEKSQSARSRDRCYNPDAGSLHPRRGQHPAVVKLFHI